MRLYGAIQKVEPQEDGTVRVYGIASSEAVDEQGEIVRADAIRAAIPDYMRFPALREMHQLSAAGSTLEAEVCGDGTTRIVAHVVDPVAVAKVRNQVYRGFSIGGRVTQRAVGNPKTITGLVLNEISLVDRPANPEAIFDCWKAAMPPDADLGFAKPAVAKDGSADTEQAPSAPQPFNAPIQIWACTVPDHRHLAKADAMKCLEGGVGLAEDRRATVAAGPASAVDLENPSRTSLSKALRDVGQIARIIAELEWLREAVELEAASENDQSPQPVRLQAIITELCDFLSSLANEEIAQIPGDAETNGSPTASAMPGMLGMADGSDLERAAAVPRKNCSNMPQLAGSIAKAKRSQGDRALLDMAHFACDQCLKFGGLSVDEQANIDRARDYLQKAGAIAAPRWTAGRAEDEDPSPAGPKCPEGDSPDVGIVKMLAIVTEVLCKRERAHENLMDLAHVCLQTLTDGCVCEKATKVGARHSKETMEFFKASHRHLVAAGARCDPTGADEPRPQPRLGSATDTRAADPANALPDGPSEKAALAKVLGEVVPMIERLTKRVDEIARTPLPPLTMAKGISVSKEQDRGSNVGSGADPQLSPEAIAAALAKMSKEEQTLTLIKASYATPIRIAGSAADQP
ncbi:MAG: hypothetical protein JOZ11_08775 [Alphaproteobacteria bacterium]|nr:hypothetical protein [Alphaproteobacteria bacterium]